MAHPLGMLLQSLLHSQWVQVLVLHSRKKTLLLLLEHPPRLPLYPKNQRGNLKPTKQVLRSMISQHRLKTRHNANLMVINQQCHLQLQLTSHLLASVEIKPKCPQPLRQKLHLPQERRCLPRQMHQLMLQSPPSRSVVFIQLQLRQLQTLKRQHQPSLLVVIPPLLLLQLLSLEFHSLPPSNGLHLRCLQLLQSERQLREKVEVGEVQRRQAKIKKAA
mmetsp:Transcript_7868/g.11399  ORF Transcript_7868/g.11399 Transcript_7868/m.11399 type:complete len:218 (+) Transcript_7868:1170-1823(+)